MAAGVVARLPLAAGLVLALLLPEAEVAAADTGELRALLDEAQELFQQASNTADPQSARQLYQQALDRFQTVVEEGWVRNAKLFYDIANTYFLLGDIGRSILFFRRAELFDPADANLQHNLRYVRSQRSDRLPSGQLSEAGRILLFWHYLLTPRVKLSLFISFFGAGCILAALAILRSKRWKIVLLPIAAGFAFLLLGSMTADEIRVRTMRDGVITAKEVVVRKGDGTAYQRSFVDPIHEGTEFRLLEERAGWHRIRLTDGRTGWIPASTGEMVMGEP